MPPNPETIPILHTLRGATATVLLALLFHPDQPLGTNDLCTLTSQSRRQDQAGRCARYAGYRTGPGDHAEPA